jgi:hypothetical protein
MIARAVKRVPPRRPGDHFNHRFWEQYRRDHPRADVILRGSQVAVWNGLSLLALCSSSMPRLSPADHAPLDQLTLALVPQALGRAAAWPRQPVGADVMCSAAPVR